jgi:hypothetical protein
MFALIKNTEFSVKHNKIVFLFPDLRMLMVYLGYISS